MSFLWISCLGKPAADATEGNGVGLRVTERRGRDVKVLPSAVEVIGCTPLVDLTRLVRKSGVEGRILAKLDYLNPGFSKKDRIARQIIEEAEEQGALKPGQTVIELTSGNTGAGLAVVCGVKGYPLVVVMSRGNSVERARMMQALGAEVVLVDQAEGSVPGQVTGEDIELIVKETERLQVERNAFRADQFALRGNYNAHYLHSGQEILRQTDGEFDVFCDFVGTGGTFGGCAAAFKEHDSSVKCFVVEPATCPVLSGGEIVSTRHKIQGGGYVMRDLVALNKSHIDGFVQVTDEEATEMSRRLAKEEGIFAGFSSGANVAAAVQLLKGPCKGKTVVVFICDSGLKYLSTDLFASRGH